MQISTDRIGQLPLQKTFDEAHEGLALKAFLMRRINLLTG